MIRGMEASRDFYQKSVVAIYVYNTESNDKDGYVSIGTGTLISCNDELLLVSARHVFERIQGEEKVSMFIGEKFVPIPNKLSYLFPNKLADTVEKDSIDLGYMIITQEDQLSFKQCSFIQKDLCFFDKGLEEKTYQLLGYPAKKNTRAINKTINHAKMEAAVLLYSVDIASEAVRNEIFEQERFSPELHTVTEKTKKGYSHIMNGHKATVPDLVGMSGGLIFKVSNYSPDTNSFLFMAPDSIIIQGLSGYDVIIGVKLSFLFHWLESQLSNRSSRT